MLKKFFKSSIAFVLAFTMIIMPAPFVNAQVNTNDISKQNTIGATATDSNTTVTGYDDVKALAQSKATFLTSIYGATSLQYAIIDNGVIVASGQSGVYSKETKTAPTKDTMYGIGSISKVFTTAAIMKLVDEGKVKLDSPVVTYIPEFTMADPRYKDITVRMLLNHSSGIMGSTFNNALLFQDNDTTSHDNLLNSLKTERLKADPGAFSVYCNDGFTLAEIVVEKVTGISFTEYIQNNISNPLGLTNTKTPMDTFEADRLAKTYFPGSSTSLPVENLNAIGAGGIYSSAENLCQFATLFMRSSTSNIVSAASVKAMENAEYLKGLWPKDNNTYFSYGIGWDCVNTYPFTDYGIKAVVKGGDTTLYHGSLIVLPEENIAMAVLSSGSSSTYNQVMAQEVLLSLLKSKGKIKEIKPNKTFTAPVKTTMPSTYKKYEGFYGSYNNIIKSQISDDGVLTLTSAVAPKSGKQEFIYTGDGKFYYIDGSAYISFVEESNGKTYLYCSGYSTLPSIGQLYSAGYQGQKLEINTISDKLKDIWKKRSNKHYYIVNEKYSSQLYAQSALSFSIDEVKGLDGYVNYSPIVDENNAKANLQIPGLYGRDIADMTYFKIDDIEYLKLRGYVGISEDDINPLSLKSSFTSKIGKEGFANWYKITKKSSNKKIKVTLPKNSSFTVYDKDGACVNCSFISGKTTFKLPANGYIVFAGDVNAKFTIKYVK